MDIMLINVAVSGLANMVVVSTSSSDSDFQLVGEDFSPLVQDEEYYCPDVVILVSLYGAQESAIAQVL
jgi:hypothetical protein